MANNIKITPASALIEFTGSSAHNVDLNVSSGGDVSFSGTTVSTIITFSDTSNLVTIGIPAKFNADVTVSRVSQTTAANIIIDADTAQFKRIRYRKGGLARFDVSVNSTTEAGSNAGSDFIIASYDDSGTSLATPLTITRSTGRSTFSVTPYVTSNAIWHAGNMGAASGLDSDLLDGQHGSYYRDATNINAGTILDTYLPTSFGGKTFTDNTIITNASTTTLFKIDGSSGNNAYIMYTRAGTNRFGMYLDNTSESGSNAGSNIRLFAYNDAGSSSSSVWTIFRNSQVVKFDQTPTVGNNAIWHAGNLATGTSGHTIPYLDGTNTWSATNVFGNTSTPGSIFINGATGTLRSIVFLTTTSRWSINTNQTAEAGSNAGSDFSLLRYNDAGSFLGTPIIIARATGQITFEAVPKVSTNVLLLSSNNLSDLTSASTARTNLGVPTGTSGHVIPFLDGSNVFSATQIISTGASNAQFVIASNAGTLRGTYYQTGASLRWILATNSTAEAGSNVGSDFELYRYDDSGSSLGTPLSISRSTGAITIANKLNSQQDFYLSGDISPSQITSDQNNYNPTSLSTSTCLRINTDALRNITGLAGGVDGRILNIMNVGAYTIVLKNSSSSSSAANRFSMGTDLYLLPNQAGTFWYDSTSSFWRLTSTSGSLVGPITSATPESFGAINDPTVDSTVAIQAWLDSPFQFLTAQGSYGYKGTTNALTLSASGKTIMGGSFVPLVNGSGYGPETSLYVSGHRNLLIGVEFWNSNDLATPTADMTFEYPMNCLVLYGNHNIVQSCRIWNFYCGVRVNGGNCIGNKVLNNLVSVKPKSNSLGWTNDAILFFYAENGLAQGNSVGISTGPTQREVLFENVAGASTNNTRCGISADASTYNISMCDNFVGEGFIVAIDHEGTGDRRNLVCRNFIYKQRRNCISPAAGRFLIEGNWCLGVFYTERTSLAGIIGGASDDNIITNNFIYCDQGASFTASITTDTLTVTAMADNSMPITPYSLVDATGITAGTALLPFGTGGTTGTGGTGTYKISISQTLGSRAMTISKVPGIKLLSGTKRVSVNHNFFFGTFSNVVEGPSTEIDISDNRLDGNCEYFASIDSYVGNNPNGNSTIINNRATGILTRFALFGSGMTGTIANNKVALLEGYSPLDGLIYITGDWASVPPQSIKVINNEFVYVGTTTLSDTKSFIYSITTTSSSIGFARDNIYPTAIFKDVITGNTESNATWRLSGNSTSTGMAYGQRIDGAPLFPDSLTPSQITSNQNDYTPTGLNGAAILRINTDASRNITGLAGGSPGRLLFLLNVGTHTAVLTDSDTLSAAANRFNLGSNLTLSGGASALLFYDGTQSRWVNLGAGAGGGGGLLPANNLSDVSSASTSRTNLGVPTGTSGAVLPFLNGTNTWSGDQTFNGSIYSSNDIYLTGITSPSQITSDQNNYGPAGLGTTTTLRINSDAARDITGLSAAVSSKLQILSNVGSFNITLKNEHTSSTGLNRFSFGADVVLGPKQSVILFYDVTLTRWVLWAFGGYNGGAVTSSGNNSWTGTNSFDNTFTTSKDRKETGTLVVGTLSADQNNWAPTGHATVSRIQFTPNGVYNITGLAGGVDGRIVGLWNYDAAGFYNYIVDQSASSIAANRFKMGASIQQPCGSTMWFIYDGAASRWVPYAYGGMALAATSNLADLPAAGSARINLGLGSMATLNGNVSSIVPVTINTTFTSASHLNALIISNGSSLSHIMPAASAFAAGSGIRIYDLAASGVTLTRAGSDTFTSPVNSAATSLSLSNGDCIFLVSDGTSKWYEIVRSNSNSPYFPLSVTTGTLKPSAGTTTVAPMILTSGTNLTSATAGGIEYDGKALYFTPETSNRAVVAVENFLSVSADQTGTNGTSAQTWFPGGGSTTITLPAGTTYEFEGLLHLVRSAGTTSHTLSLLFGGTATITSINFTVMATSTTGNVLSSPSMIRSDAATAVIVTAASISATENNEVWVKGFIRINASGTLIPQFKYDVAPGGAPTIKANSFFRLKARGSGTVLSVGNWS